MATNLPKRLEDKSAALLTEADVQYQADRIGGMVAERALEKNYKNDPEWGEFFETLPTKPQERKIALRWAARELEQRKEMKMLAQAMNKRVAELAPLALDTMEQIMVESKSDKVRADVAIELLRQNIGTPDKQDTNNTNITVVIGKDPNLGVIDGEIVDDRF